MVDDFFNQGYAEGNQFFDEKDLVLVEKMMETLVDSKNVDLYKDRNGNLRRIEKFTFSDTIFTELNSKIIALLKSITGKDFALLKDKINFKPPKGEGFYAHYDGIFKFSKPDGSFGNGWFEYGDTFVNVLIALDDFTVENGALEISKFHEGDFNTLLENTTKDGSSNLLPHIEKGCDWKPVLIKRGGAAIFLNSCPHRSAANHSQKSRGSLYFTYAPKEFGDNYSKYFSDKKKSSNKYKAQAGSR